MLETIAIGFCILVAFFFGHMAGFSAARRKLEDMLEFRRTFVIPEDGFYFIEFGSSNVVRSYKEGDRLFGDCSRVAGPIPEPGDLKL